MCVFVLICNGIFHYFTNKNHYCTKNVPDLYLLIALGVTIDWKVKQAVLSYCAAAWSFRGIVRDTSCRRY